MPDIIARGYAVEDVTVPARIANEARANQLSVHALRFCRSDSGLAALEAVTSGIPLNLIEATTKRKLEFLAGRRCATLALRRHGLIGHADVAVGRDRAPVWPAGFVGSITHSGDLAAAVVGGNRGLIGLGIDIEQQISPERVRSIRHVVLTDTEMELGCVAGFPLAAWLTLVFSAKESVFKALFPGIGRYFDFLDIAVASVSVPRGTLALSLRRPLADAWPVGRTVEVAFGASGEATFTLCVVREGLHPAAGAFSA